jgi:hypothetical protein
VALRLEGEDLGGYAKINVPTPLTTPLTHVDRHQRDVESGLECLPRWKKIVSLNGPAGTESIAHHSWAATGRGRKGRIQTGVDEISEIDRDSIAGIVIESVWAFRLILT